jgi:hypothetical protein
VDLKAAAAAAEQILNAGQPAKPHPLTVRLSPARPRTMTFTVFFWGRNHRKKACHWPAMPQVPTPSPVRWPWSTETTICTRLLPFITHAFNSWTVIDSNQEPTFGRNVMANDSD